MILAGDTLTQVKIYWNQDDNYMAELHVKSVNACGESEFSESLNIYVNWTIGVGEHSKPKPYTCYPNPNDGQFTLSFEKGSEINKVLLLNSQGSEVNAYKVGNGTLSVRDVPAGLYFLKIEVSGNTYYEKMLVR